MTFANPFAWALLALLVVPILLYLLPMPRRRADQPSLILWKRMFQARPATQSWRWLRTLVSFAFQAAILVLLVLAVGKPLFSPAEGEGNTAVVVLDASASMRAPAAPGAMDTRFDRARAVARSLVAAMPSGRRVAVVAAEVSPRIVSGLTDRREDVLRAIEARQCPAHPGDLASALRAALELAAGESNADVYLISDGGAELASLPLAGAKLHWLSVGESLPNAGIVTCRARRAFENPDDFEALVRVQNASREERAVTLKVAMDDNVIDTRALTLAPGATVSENLTGKVRGKGVLRLALEPGDAFPLDDAAAVPLGSSLRTQVVLVRDVADRFIESALTANRGIDTYPATLSEYLEKRPRPDVLIFSGVLPPELPEGNLFIINPPNATTLFQVAEPSAPKALDWRRDHRVFADVTLKDVYVPSARTLKAASDAETLLTGDGAPLMLAFDVLGRRTVALGFDPGKTSLSFRVAFPVIVANTLAWLTRDTGAPPASPNLADAAESNLAVPEKLIFADAQVAGRASRGGGLGEFWILAAAAAVALVAVEWYLYHHRITV